MTASTFRAAQIMRALSTKRSWEHTSRMMSTSVISNGNKLFVSIHDRTQSVSSSNNKRLIMPIHHQSFRLNSTSEAAANDKQISKVIDEMIVVHPKAATDESKTEAVWAALENVPEPIKGAIIPFSQLNFLQVMFFPYTYAAMYYLDLMHQFLPWWLAIIATTATARLVLFPLILKQNVIGIKTANILPQTQKLYVKMNEAMVSGDAYNQALYRTKIQLLNKEHGLSMKERLLPILIQAPMYASVFFLLRTLTAASAEGLSTGGAFWFTDLTVPDPYYLLPLLTSTSLFVLLEFGLEGATSPSQGMAPIGRYLMRAMPFGLFFIVQGFPAATLLFWSTSNLFTLFYAFLFKNKWIKTKFNIPTRIQHDPSDLPLANMSFSGQVKNAIDKGKVKRTSIDIRRLDDIAFKKAGVGPLRKTYKEPPKEL